jgi:hypothetical protein
LRVAGHSRPESISLKIEEVPTVAGTQNRVISGTRSAIPKLPQDVDVGRGERLAKNPTEGTILRFGKAGRGDHIIRNHHIRKCWFLSFARRPDLQHFWLWLGFCGF